MTATRFIIIHFLLEKCVRFSRIADSLEAWNFLDPLAPLEEGILCVRERVSSVSCLFAEED